jgi:hypothetical protein
VSEYISARPADGNSVLYATEEGTRAIRQGGTRAWRNNNPGNIRSGPFADRHGAIGEAGGFAAFPDEATGRKALHALLSTRTYQRLTVGQAIGRYAPSNENPTEQYIRGITQITGIPASKPMGDLSSKEEERVVDAIQRIEGWNEGIVVPVPSKKPHLRLQSSLDESVENLDKAAISAIMGSRAYTSPSHPDNRRAHRTVRAWFERQYGTEPAQFDAAGRMIWPSPRRLPEAEGSCIVEVREHTRDSGRIHVGSHTRSCPSP